MTGTTEPQPDLRLPRVLVVDDEPPIRELLSMVCAHEGWDVVTAGAGEPAITEARATRPDVVLLDRMLPDLDGLEVLRRLRADAPALPVVLVTARDSAEDRAEALAAGVTGYVGKPFALTDLVATVRRALDPSTAAQFTCR